MIYENLTVAQVAKALSPSVYGSLDESKTIATVFVEDNAVRFRVDGTAPTTTVGHLVQPGQTIKLKTPAEIKNFRTIAPTGTAIVTIFYADITITGTAAGSSTNTGATSVTELNDSATFTTTAGIHRYILTGANPFSFPALSSADSKLQYYLIKGEAANVVTINADGSDLINGQADPILLNELGETVIVVPTSTGWLTLNLTYYRY